MPPPTPLPIACCCAAVTRGINNVDQRYGISEKAQRIGDQANREFSKARESVRMVVCTGEAGGWGVICMAKTRQCGQPAYRTFRPKHAIVASQPPILIALCPHIPLIPGHAQPQGGQRRGKSVLILRQSSDQGVRHAYGTCPPTHITSPVALIPCLMDLS